MGLFHRSSPPGQLAPVPLVTPRATVDGWSLEGTPLHRTVPRSRQRELCTLLHGVAVGVDTPYTYLRAAQILEEAGELAQAHAVCAAWLASPGVGRSEYAHRTRALARQRDRLIQRLPDRTAGSSAAPAC